MNTSESVRSLRILFCNFEYPPLGGGGGIVNALLAEELARKHEVTVLTSKAPGAESKVVEGGVRIIRVPVFFRRQQATASLASMLAYLPMGVLYGRRLLQTERYDVVNTHFVLPTGPVGGILARLGRVPNVLSVHGGDVYDPSKWTSPHRHALLRLWVRKLLRQADCVVGQSRNTLDNVRHYYVPEMEGVRIPLGIRRPAHDQASRSRYGFGEDDILLVTVGRLVARKQVRQLVELIAGLQSPGVHLLVVGTGREEQQLRDLTRRRRVEQRTHFLGYVEEAEKSRLLRMADIFVSASQHEGFGLVFLEAMAAGLPIICYDHGGQTDFLESGRSGYVLPLDDEARFLDRCRHLIQDRTARKAMGAENVRRVQEYFIDNCAARYEQLFCDIITRYHRCS